MSRDTIIKDIQTASTAIFKDKPDNLFLQAVELIEELRAENERLRGGGKNNV